ncbi:hypothetical protein DM860_015166 [Cuscuta australis]|uniref:Transcriptional coactivator Hfi1/Transcriptional adapter 1 n=1 Tax=Cuscuta australis TaxID=267555 RepID=A0A328DCS3_9ASTE|nr:hypothetical protein DM860_015166 [Cuscuta australis]
MQPPHQHTRINLVELKAQIVRKLGPDGSKQYFHYLSNLLSLKMSKTEFNKLCVRVLGRENIPLHNQFIRSVLKNACCAKVPPSRSENEVSAQAIAKNKDPSSDDAIEQNGPHVASNQPRLSNGNTLPSPPCSNTIIENGDLPVAMHHHQGIMQRTEHDAAVLGQAPRNPLVTKRPHEQRSSLQAPLGVSHCPVGVGGALRASLHLATASKSVRTDSTSVGALLDSLTLRERMNQIATEHGLEGGVSVDCANLLNIGLDSHLKGLIGSCVQLVGARRSGQNGTVNTNTVKQQHQAYTKPVNGVRPGYQLQLNTGRPSEVLQEEPLPPQSFISLQDFKVAMELNPQQLGEDWPVLLEKICTRETDEHV